MEASNKTREGTFAKESRVKLHAMHRARKRITFQTKIEKKNNNQT